VVHIPVWASLLAIVAILAVALVASLRATVPVPTSTEEVAS
jgi:hypothetical protein